MKSKFKVSISAIVAAVILVACASKGYVSSPESASTNTSAQNPSDQLVCKRQPVTGTRVRKLVCLTRAEMEQQRRDGERTMRDAVNASRAVDPVPK